MNKITLNKVIKGSILDIGGGGEGIIGSIYKNQVTAIDNRQEELDEAPEGFTKILMDACNLEFDDIYFENATLFYALMYIEKEKQVKVLKEAYRVIKDEGHLYIWDTNIKVANPFLVNLNIDTNSSVISTTYGIYKENAFQDYKHFKIICENIGFKLVNEFIEEDQFYLHFIK